MRTGSLESLRELNRLRVVETLRERGTASRADVARVTGLSRSTVSSLVADLQAHGLIVEDSAPDAPPSTATGRPPTLLSLDRSAGAVVGIDFGHDCIRAAVSDLSRTVIAEAVGRYAIAPAAEDARVVAGVLGERAQVLGALALALLQSEHLAARLATHPMPSRRGEATAHA